MCIFANLNTITRGLSYRVGHLQQYYEVLLICQQTKAYHLQLCILFIQKLPSISRQKPLSRSDKDRLADKRIPHKGIFPTSNSVARIWISYLYSQWTLVTQIAQETIQITLHLILDSLQFPQGAQAGGVFPYQYKSVYLPLKEKILVQVRSGELLLCQD